MRKVLRLVKLYILNKIRSPIQVGMSLLWGLGFFIFLYFVFVKGGLSFGSENFKQQFIASYSVFVPAYIGLFGLTHSVISDKSGGILEIYRGSRLTETEYFAAKILAALLSSMFMAAVIITTGFIFTSISLNILLAFLLVLFTVFVHSGIGLIIAGYAENETDAQMIMPIIMLTMAIATPVFYSQSFVPEYLQPLQSLIPLTHSIEGMRALILGTGSAISSLIVLIGFSVIILGLAYNRFEY